MFKVFDRQILHDVGESREIGVGGLMEVEEPLESVLVEDKVGRKPLGFFGSTRSARCGHGVQL